MGLSRKVLILLRGGRTFRYPKIEAPIMEATDTQQTIYEMLLSSNPCMIARFGSVELQSVID